MDTLFQYDIGLLPHYLDLLRTKLRIAVVYGGDKSQSGSVIYQVHNPRDWKSYEHVARSIQVALQELGFAYVTLLPDDMRLPQRLADDGINLVWLNTGGVQGYNPTSHAPAMLEMLGIPYIGHNPLNAALLDNKDTFKRSLQAFGIKTALDSGADVVVTAVAGVPAGKQDRCAAESTLRPRAGSWRSHRRAAPRRRASSSS